MIGLRVAAFAMAAAAAVAAAGPSVAPPAVAELGGHYTFDRAASDDVNRAIDDAVRPMGFVARRVARGRLRRSNPLYQNLTLALSPTEVSTQFDGAPPIVTPAGGAPVPWTRENGDAFRVATHVAADSLVQTFVGSEGRRENVYALGSDGSTLTVSVTMSSPRLPRVLVYQLVYRRHQS